MDNTSEARRKKIMRRKRAMLKRTHRRINVTFIIVFVLLRYFPSSDVTLFTSSIRLYTFSLYARTVPSLAVILPRI